MHMTTGAETISAPIAIFCKENQMERRIAWIVEPLARSPIASVPYPVARNYLCPNLSLEP
jgi:hypothetical protein